MLGVGIGERFVKCEFFQIVEEFKYNLFGFFLGMEDQGEGFLYICLNVYFCVGKEVSCVLVYYIVGVRSFVQEMQFWN